MHKLTLNGQWECRRCGTEQVISATVPGVVHMDLLRAGLLEDMNWRDNEQKQQWIAETVCLTAGNSISRRLFRPVSHPVRARAGTLADIWSMARKSCNADNCSALEVDVKDTCKAASTASKCTFTRRCPYDERQMEGRCRAGTFYTFRVIAVRAGCGKMT
jgi:beta-mannosidase